MDIQRLKERIKNVITNPDEEQKWGRVWDQGYNAACEQILEMIEEMEKGV